LSTSRKVIVVVGPPADRAGGDAETFRHLGDREKLDLIVAMAAPVGGAKSTGLVVAVAGG
jgi:hypothetical protein